MEIDIQIIKIEQQDILATNAVFTRFKQFGLLNKRKIKKNPRLFFSEVVALWKTSNTRKWYLRKKTG